MECLHNGPGGYSWEFLTGLCHSVLLILILFQTKNAIFYTHFYTRTAQKPSSLGQHGLYKGVPPGDRDHQVVSQTR